MKSSSGQHFLALDHIRACAALLVIVWHFTHGQLGFPVPFSYVPALPPMALFDEGHTGVALFMTLSGYLFARLIGENTIRYRAFLWNRCLRLLPLLSVVIIIAGAISIADGTSWQDYLKRIGMGFMYPTLPNGGWSITAEFHAYLLFPLLLKMRQQRPWLPLVIVALAVLTRLAWFYMEGDVQLMAYGTIIGRVDQFVMGITAYSYRGYLTRRPLQICACFVLFVWMYWIFDQWGGFYGTLASSSGHKAVWVILPTLEAAMYAMLIAWYDQSFSPRNTGFSRLLGLLGAYSYAIYLLHFFVVFAAARFVHEQVMVISNFYLATLWAMVFYLAMLPVALLSFRMIEAPFLKLRRHYLVPA